MSWRRRAPGSPAPVKALLETIFMEERQLKKLEITLVITADLDDALTLHDRVRELVGAAPVAVTIRALDPSGPQTVEAMVQASLEALMADLS